MAHLEGNRIVNDSFDDLAHYLRQLIEQNRDIIRLLNLIAKISDAPLPADR